MFKIISSTKTDNEIHLEELIEFYGYTAVIELKKREFRFLEVDIARDSKKYQDNFSKLAVEKEKLDKNCQAREYLETEIEYLEKALNSKK